MLKGIQEFMSKEEQILNLIKVNNGIITSKEVSKHGINRIFLTRLVKSGKIERVKKDYMFYQILGEMNILI